MNPAGGPCCSAGMTIRRPDIEAETWRRQAAKLRDRAATAADPIDRQQLLVFAEDCERQAVASDDRLWRDAYRA